MDMSTVLIGAMVLMMVVMCGGMIAGGIWAIFRRHRGDGESEDDG
jgi:hypothetical protein